jgi:dihydrofolate reductase
MSIKKLSQHPLYIAGLIPPVRRKSAVSLQHKSISGPVQKVKDHWKFGKGEADSGQTAMRKIILELSVSRDGFIEGPNGELDWLMFDEGLSNQGSLMSDFDTMFYGRKAYEKLGVLPFIDDGFSETEREFHYALYGMRKYVFSRSRKHVAGNGMVVSDNLEAEVRRIREEDGKKIWFCGGADIMNTFASLDLIDEYLITVHPVTLHAGKPLFERRIWPLNLSLVDKHNLKSGLVILHYLPESRLKNAPW